MWPHVMALGNHLLNLRLQCGAAEKVAGQEEGGLHAARLKGVEYGGGAFAVVVAGEDEGESLGRCVSA